MQSGPEISYRVRNKLIMKVSVGRALVQMAPTNHGCLLEFLAVPDAKCVCGVRCPDYCTLAIVCAAMVLSCKGIQIFTE